MSPTGPKRYPKSYRKKDAEKCIARVYSGVNLSKPLSYYNDELEVQWNDQGRYEITRQLGKGKYGDVYQGIDVVDGSICVVKIMKPVRESRLLREIKILQHVQGGPHIVKLLDLVRDPETKTPSFVFEYVDAMDFRQLIKVITIGDVQLYLYQLLRALDYTHSKGIMHRDVKPPNLLIDHPNRQLLLIDWGLADFYFPGKQYPVRVATRYYKGPEIICDLKDYDYSLDLWAVGCTLGAMIFRKPVLFKGEDEFDQLVKITDMLGTDDLFAFTKKYGIELDLELAALVGKSPKKPWSTLVNPANQDLVTPDALDLLDRLLTFDHHERITAAEALQHPFFETVRDLQLDRLQQQHQQRSRLAAA